MAQNYAEAIWNGEYRVPPPTNHNVGDYPLARNLVMLTVALTCETIIRFVENGRRKSRTLTLGDFAVQEIAAE